MESKPTENELPQHERFFYSFKSKYPNIHTLHKVVAIIFIWIGIWGLADTYLFPESPLLRYLTLLIVGVIVLYIDDRSLSELTDIQR